MIPSPCQCDALEALKYLAVTTLLMAVLWGVVSGIWSLAHWALGS